MIELIAAIATVIGTLIAYETLKHQRLEARKKAQRSDSAPATAEVLGTAQHENPKSNMRFPPGELPEGITLGNQVVLVPGLQQLLFSHSGRTNEYLMQKRVYGWVQRGEVIGRYHMDVPRSNANYFRHIWGEEHISVEVKSPVSGLILHAYFSDFVWWPEQSEVTVDTPRPTFSVLVADDEPKPETGEWMFRDVCRFIRDHSWPFFRESRYWSLPAMTEEQFEKLLDMQINAQCLRIDALPKFEDYLDEARTKYPKLRPHLKHLR